MRISIVRITTCIDYESVSWELPLVLIWFILFIFMKYVSLLRKDYLFEFIYKKIESNEV